MLAAVVARADDVLDASLIQADANKQRSIAGQDCPNFTSMR
jgi:hypothetical protein